MKEILRGFLDIELLSDFKMHILDEFSIKGNNLIIPGKRNARHLLPEQFIPDDMFLRLFKHFNYPGYFAGIDGFFTISEKQPMDLELDMHTDTEAYKWVDVEALTVWIPLSEISPTKAPGLIIEGEIPELSMGDCVIFDNNTLHGTHCYEGQTEVRHSIDFRLLSVNKPPPIPHNARISHYPFEEIIRV